MENCSENLESKAKSYIKEEVGLLQDNGIEYVLFLN